MPLQPVQRQSVADAVFEQLLGGVLNGELAAGSTLPSERTLTGELGVNRQAVREALQRLAQAGVLDIRHGGATRVLDYRQAAGLDLLPRLLIRPDGTVDAHAVGSLMELRLCLGPEIARRCAERAGEDTATSVDELVHAMIGAYDDLGALAALDLRLWDALVTGADNIAYRLAFNGLRRTWEPVADLFTDILAGELHDMRARLRIAAAVAERNGDDAAVAASALLAHGARAVAMALEELDR
jgi:GntR family transcriptional regulator, transcriptional repressor for pyruvate dehydrogenase complex